jgi:hypothetical protein
MVDVHSLKNYIDDELEELYTELRKFADTVGILTDIVKIDQNIKIEKLDKIVMVEEAIDHRTLAQIRLEFGKKIAELKSAIADVNADHIRRYNELKELYAGVLTAHALKSKELDELKMDIKNIIGDEEDFLDDINTLKERVEKLEWCEKQNDRLLTKYIEKQLEGEKPSEAFENLLIKHTQTVWERDYDDDVEIDPIKEPTDDYQLGYGDAMAKNNLDLIETLKTHVLVETDDIKRVKEDRNLLRWFLDKYLSEEK